MKKPRPSQNRRRLTQADHSRMMVAKKDRGEWLDRDGNPVRVPHMTASEFAAKVRAGGLPGGQVTRYRTIP